MSNFILLEDRKSTSAEKKSLYFNQPIEEIICRSPNDLENCLERIEALKEKGCYLVGYVSYEASYGFDESPIQSFSYHNHFPLLHFLAFKSCDRLTQADVGDLLGHLTKNSLAESFAYNISLTIDAIEYKNTIDELKKHIYQGNTYQVNYTGKYTFDLQGDPIKLYQALRERQKVAYTALLHFNDYQILSFSPELFFCKEGEDVTTKPMKGTMPRSSNLDIDKANLAELTNNPKLIAENIIIVDLLRNDLSRISYPGSVSVSNLLQAETFETVHQMTSTIHSKVDAKTPFKTFLYHLFPCGSITGAPKRQTMQIIHDYEKEPRNIYTGSIGYITPTNDMCFNVAIRTLLIKNNKGELGVGGGIIHDSTADDEFKELQLKAQFFTEMDVTFKLLESIKYNCHGGYYLLEEHLQRLRNSASVLNFSYDEELIRRELQKLLPDVSNTLTYKIRLILAKNGQVDLSFLTIDTNPHKDKPTVFVYEKERVTMENVLLHHKTIESSVRRFYDNVMSSHPEYADVIFMNEEGYITEGSRTNVFIQLHGELLTPPVSCGLLPGTMRQKLLANNPSIKEATISLKDLHQAERIWITNSVRGITEVFL